MGALDGLSVLLLEDEFLIALEAEDMLARMGAARIEIAQDLEEADRLLAENSFDVAMLDVNVNGKSSLGLASELKRRGVPVLFATGYELKSKSIPADDSSPYITKPYSADRLESALLSTLESTP
ncbi:MAG TPA: response regulator [Hyphomonadaceae bacterium]|nr:response regulator [Hyphomonadaceae bacterium]